VALEQVGLGLRCHLSQRLHGSRSFSVPQHDSAGQQSPIAFQDSELWRWAFQRGDIEVDPMARMKPADNWVNVEHLTPALYTQILRVIAGKESPAKGQETTNDFLTLLPYFFLAGLGGVRNCELIRYKRGEPVLQWADILWKKDLIFIRHEVAKETRARDRKRYI
jgi:hypothetical protein